MSRSAVSAKHLPASPERGLVQQTTEHTIAPCTAGREPLSRNFSNTAQFVSRIV